MGTNGKKTGENTKALAKVKNEVDVSRPQKKLSWGGVMPKVGDNEKDKMQLQNFCNAVAKIYGVPSTGVNAMGGQPYLNKVGRLYLLGDLRKGKEGLKKVEKEFIQMSTGADVPAIMKVRLIFKDGLEVEAIGEASKQSVKLDAVKSTLNMMAETRALNRAIWEAIAFSAMERIAKNIAKMNMSEDEKEKVQNAGASSYEEMVRPEDKQAPTKKKPTASSAEELLGIVFDAINRAKTIGDIIDIDEKAQESGKLSKAQKDQIHAYANERVNKLQA